MSLEDPTTPAHSDRSSLSGGSSGQAQSPLLRTPSEIIHRVLCCSAVDDPQTLVSAAKTCRDLRSFIYDNPDTALWRDIHLQRWDDPRDAGGFVDRRTEFDWQKRVQDRELVSRILSWEEDRHHELREHIDVIAQTLLDIYLDLPSLRADRSDLQPGEDDEDDADEDEDTSDVPSACRNANLLDRLLWTDAFKRLVLQSNATTTFRPLRPLRSQPGNPLRRPQREVINHNLSRLHILLTPELDFDDEAHLDFRGFMREVVYTATNFTKANDWGPFHKDGTVDWALVQAIGVVMMVNATDVNDEGDEHWAPVKRILDGRLDVSRGAGLFNVQRPLKLKSNEVWDWAGVEGQWCGSYSFLDYRDWMALNNPHALALRGSHIELDLSTYREAVGDLMRLQLVLDRPGDKLPDFPEINTNLPTSDLFPPLTFHGSSVAQSELTNFGMTASFVRGVVQLTADNPPQVRWTLIIRYGGDDRWRLECVQPGGRLSQRGFFGIWTDAAREDNSPNGPVWYWKA